MEKLNKREKIMMGISIASIGALGVLGFKYLDTKKTIELLTKEKEGVNDRLNFIELLVIEEAKLIEHIAKAMKLNEAVKADQNIYAK